jgi:signal transduction histidine kinase
VDNISRGRRHAAWAAGVRREAARGRLMPATSLPGSREVSGGEPGSGDGRPAPQPPASPAGDGDGWLGWYSRRLLDSLSTGVIGLDRHHRIVLLTPKAAELVGVGADVVGRRLDQVVRKAAQRRQFPGIEMLVQIARDTMATSRPSSGHEFSYGPDRGRGALSVECSPVHGEDGRLRGAALFLRDVTERRQAEAEMRQVHQMAAIGYLAASIAHEIRNPLSAIKAAAQYLQHECEDNPLIAQFASIIDDESNRLTRIITDFLIYARPQPPSRVPIGLPELLGRCLRLLEPELAKVGVDVDIRYSRRLPPLLVDRDQMQQVLVNVLNNAVQAMEGGGMVRIRARLRRARQEGGDSTVEITIEDEGAGIPPKDLEHIFTPFFTTKTKGSGLGLPICQRIVESHGGTIAVENSRRGGARCRIELPLHPGAESPSAPEAARPASRLELLAAREPWSRGQEDDSP